MYTDQWWESYRQWAAETSAAHENLRQAAIKAVTDALAWEEFWSTIDLGCGRLLQGEALCDAAQCRLYIGVDADQPEDCEPYSNIEKWIADDFADEWDGSSVFVRQSWDDFDFDRAVGHAQGHVLAVSLYAVELYAADPEDVYRRAFAAGVDAFISAGVRYHGTPVDQAFGEPGSMVRQTDPQVPPYPPSKLWDELRISKHVPSLMFGDDVIEVWRVMTRKDDEE